MGWLSARRVSSILMCFFTFSLACSQTAEFEDSHDSLGGFAYIADPGSSGRLKVPYANISPVGTTSVQPCIARGALSVAPQIDAVLLMQDITAAPGFGTTYTYAVRASMEVRNVTNAVVGRDERLVSLGEMDIASNSPTRVPGLISLSWDATYIDGANSLQIVPAGTYSASVRVRLEKLSVTGTSVSSAVLVDAGTISGSFITSSSSEQCTAWKAAFGTLANAPSGSVRFNGVDIVGRPSVRWANGLPSMAFGAFIQRVSPTTRLTAFRQALSNYRTLFGFSQASLANTLQQVDERAYALGTAVSARQNTTDGQYSRPVYGQRIVGQFDPADMLVRISGHFANDLPAAISAEAVNLTSAVATVNADLASLGESNPRTVTLTERAAYRLSTGVYEPVFVLDVPPAASGVGRPYEYVVSGMTGAIRERNRTTLNDYTSPVSLFAMDPTLLERNSRATPPIAGVNTPLTKTAQLWVTNQTPFRLESPLLVARTTVFSAGATDQYQMQWNDLNFDRKPHSTVPAGFESDLPSTGLRSRKSLFSAYTLVRDFLGFANYHMGVVSDTPVEIQIFDDPGVHPNTCGAGSACYRGGVLHLLTLDPSQRAGQETATHEAFHHIERSTSRLKLGCFGFTSGPHQDWDTINSRCITPTTDHRMPHHLAEGLADFATDYSFPFPVPYAVDNSQSQALSSIVCPLLGDRTSVQRCFNNAFSNYRKKASEQLRPDSDTVASCSGSPPVCSGPGASTFAQWEDCSPGGRSNCLNVAVPGTGILSSYPFSPSPPTPFLLYRLAPQILLRTWERLPSFVFAATNSVPKANEVAAEFPSVAISMLRTLPSDASFGDLRETLKNEVVFKCIVTPACSGSLDYGILRSAIDDLFAQHGINSVLEAYCERNASQCH